MPTRIRFSGAYRLCIHVRRCDRGVWNQCAATVNDGPGQGARSATLRTGIRERHKAEEWQKKEEFSIEAHL